MSDRAAPATLSTEPSARNPLSRLIPPTRSACPVDPGGRAAVFDDEDRVKRGL